MRASTTQSRSWPSPAALASSAPGQKHGKTTTQPAGCCWGLKDSLTMGSNVSANRRDEPTSKLEQQVADLEREVEKQKELRITYRKRMERTQDYLRHCLQIAQENGFLDLIMQNNDAPHAPQTPTPPHQHSELSSLADVAKLNGWYIAPDEIELQEEIGHGSTANIHRGTWRGLGVAVKCLRPDFFQNDRGLAFFAQEMETLARQRHHFVLQLMGACLEPPFRAWAVTEYLSMTLEDWLHGPSKRRAQERLSPLPPLKERLGRALEISLAMQYLHGQRPKVLHRDLKPSNIFLDDALHVRVADFGHARFLSDAEMALSGQTGTYVYMAPEVIKCEPYNEKCDVYSFGVILNELTTGEYPYVQLDYGPTKIAMEVVESNLRPRLPNNDSGQLDELIELICLTWNEDAAIRPPFATITSILKRLQNRHFESVTL